MDSQEEMTDRVAKNAVRRKKSNNVVCIGFMG